MRSLLDTNLGPARLGTLRYGRVVRGDPDRVQLAELLHRLEAPGQQRLPAERGDVLERDPLTASSSQHKASHVGVSHHKTELPHHSIPSLQFPSKKDQ